ncbi:Nucleoside phosphorylase domain-containing protein [Plasmodiophora brassicae]|uniref:Nucleoside phosphorylase domain-containing protein n=1 Tax=Plasmodiophora brassicae TaxID=37360 RepID=A0A0G4ITU0_PLABS|nr:hypothetical protein PBRA_006769 [Plasmodiophora brassicae]SPR00793.1 unnamed protein product [Plasmodiophora brassicae]
MAPSASHPTTTTLDGGPVAVIAGSSFLQSAHHWLGDGACLSRDVTTPFGDVAVTCATIAAVGVVFVQRHRCTADRAYRIPTRINFQAIWWALKHHFNVAAVVGIGSAGSLRRDIPVGSLVVPDDYFSPFHIVSMSEDESSHAVPGFHTALRQRLLSWTTRLAAANAIRVVDEGVYYQSRGPRFETKAEIRAMARDGDVVGMTCANEATLANELGIPYALICSVDNYANGVSPADTLTLDGFRQATKEHLPIAEVAFRAALGALGLETKAS